MRFYREVVQKLKLPNNSNDSAKTANEWRNYESHIHTNMDYIFQALDGSRTKATFFCLGWIVEKYPDVIKAIVGRGYEVGTHTDMHQLIYEQNPNVFKADIERSMKNPALKGRGIFVLPRNCIRGLIPLRTP
jgi:peptidoglycan/xylan/chitin deacetylase (PgdA/CDA1 family)